MSSGARGQFVLVLAFALSVPATVTAVGVLNVVVNPRSEFEIHLFPPLLANEMQSKVDLFDARDPAPEVLIFGTSRSMTIRPSDLESLGRGSAFNFAAPSSRATDMLAVMRYAVATGRAPREIVFGVDLDRLSDEHANWQVRFSPKLGPYSGAPPTPEERREFVEPIFTASYTRDSLTVLTYSVVGYPERAAAIDPDGVRHWPLKERLLTSGYDVDAEIARDIAENPRALAYFNEQSPPQPDALAALALLVSEARAARIEVLFFLPPLHPRFEEALAGSPFEAALAAERDALVALCRPGVRVVDATSVASFNGDPRGFYDAVHMTPENSRQLVAHVFDQASDLCGGSTN